MNTARQRRNEKMAVTSAILFFIVMFCSIFASHCHAAVAFSPVNVASVAALKTLTPGSFPSVSVQGYYSASYGGGGLMDWNSTSTATPDSCTVYKPNSNPSKGRWIRRFTGVIDVQGCGAYGDAIHDDTPALKAGLALGSGQYGGVGLDLKSGRYVFTQTLELRKRTGGTGWVLLPKGDGTNFKAANSLYPLTTAPTRVDCMIVIQDGGVLEGGVVQITTDSLDNVANYDMWVVDLESNFGKNPLYNVRIDGRTSGRNLSGVISRYNTTCKIGSFGGSYFRNGFEVDACNICEFRNIFFEQTGRGSKPFYFTNSSHNSAADLWTEANGNNIVAFTFDGVSNYRVKNLQVGEPAGGATQHSTATASNDSITQNSNYPLLVNDRIYFDTVVTGLTTGTLYCIVQATATSFQVGTTCGGAAANITANGGVEWRSALANAVRLTSSTNCILEGLKIETGAVWSAGVTLLNGSTASVRADNTFFTTAASYGMWSEDQFENIRSNPIRNIDVSDTTVYRFVGDIKSGTQITFTNVATASTLSGTDGSLNVFYLDGSGYHTIGTASVSSGALGFIGNVVSTTMNIPGNYRVFVAPVTPAGTGTFDVYAKWNIVDGL